MEWLAPGKPIASAVYELYDYQEDPLETVNIASSDQKALARMQALLATEPAAKPRVQRRR